MDEENQGQGPQEDIIDFGGDDGGGQQDDPQPERSQEEPDSVYAEHENRAQQQDDDDPEEEWDVGGQKFKVKKSELRAGYMKDADYRQKTAKAAEQQRAAAQLIERVQQEHHQRANHLDAFMGSLQRELLGSQPDPRLIDDNPQEFLRQTAQYNQRAQLMNQAIAERQGLAQQQQAMQHQRLTQNLAAEKERLSSAIPEWRDSKTQQAEQQLIAQTLQKAGYAPEEIGSVQDHRAVVLARKAALYDQMISARAKQSPPPLPKPIRPGSAGSNRTDSVAARARDRLSRNPGDMDALAGLLGASGF